MSEEERVEAEKQAVAAMSNAKANMDKSLSRIRALESALSEAASNLERAADYVGASAYVYNTTTKVQDKLKEQAEKARRVV